MIKISISVFSLFCIFIVSSLTAVAQPKVDSDTDKRIISSISQLTGALSIQRGLSNDPNCSKKKYNPLPLDDFVSQLASLNISKNFKSPSKSEINDLKKSLTNALNVEVPGRGVMWKVMYDTMSETIKITLKVSGEELCNALNDSALSLFGKSIDNIKLIK
jgi:hypothetical protein